jgi:hypothetical protein
MIHQLAEKRCADFGTCTDGRAGAASANEKHLAYARRGRNKILDGDCYTVVGEFDAIVNQMTVPLIQGMLKYAFKADPANTFGSCETTGDNCDKSWAEGWAFAAAVLPRLNYCSTADNDVAKIVTENLDVSLSEPMKDGFATLKTKVESLYACLGITCADIGAFQTSTGAYEGMEACEDPETESESDSDSIKDATAKDEATTEAPSNAAIATESSAAMLGMAMLLLIA